LSIKNSNLEVSNFDLVTSSEVPELVRTIDKLKKKTTLIHISAFIHNTVLVQNLKKELANTIPNARIVSLKHENKNKTSVSIFTMDLEIENENIDAKILQELNPESWNKEISINEYRNQLFKRYFTDHLTNLPNSIN